jgi:predicted metalloprotease
MKAIFRRLSRKLDNWSENRIRDVWHRDPRIKVRADEVSQLRALVEPKRKTESIHDLEELRATVARLARYEAVLQRLDEEFFGPEISAARDQLGEASRVLGASGIRLRPGTRG